MDIKESEPDILAGDVEKAILSGKYKDATEKEAMLTRLAALEGLVSSYRDVVSQFDDKRHSSRPALCSLS